MSIKTLYHNLTTKELNIGDLGDAVEYSTQGDDVRFSRAGCALMLDIRSKDEDDFNEFEFIRNDFKERFKEFHEQEF